jgi:diacylglycerol kinase (ATP)
VIGLIANPRALRMARDPMLVERLRAALGSQGMVAATRSIDELRAALDDFRAAGCDRIAVCGGDGTNLFVLTELADRWTDPPPIILLRGGTINLVAKNLGVRGEPEAILRRLLSGRRGGEAPRQAELDVIRVNDRCGFVFGAGIPARFLEAYYDGRGTGRPRAVALVARTLASALWGGPFARRLLEPTNVEIVADELRARGRSNLILATSVRDVGLGLRVGYRAGRDAGRFHALALAAKRRDLWISLWPALRGRPLPMASSLDALARRLEITFPGPTPYLVDGEMCRGTTVRVEVGPRVRFEIP